MVEVRVTLFRLSRKNGTMGKLSTCAIHTKMLSRPLAQLHVLLITETKMPTSIFWHLVYPYIYHAYWATKGGLNVDDAFYVWICMRLNYFTF